MNPLFEPQTPSERVETLFRKSRTSWLTKEELKELIEIRDTIDDKFYSKFADNIIQEQNDKMCGKKHW